MRGAVGLLQTVAIRRKNFAIAFVSRGPGGGLFSRGPRASRRVCWAIPERRCRWWWGVSRSSSSSSSRRTFFLHEKLQPPLLTEGRFCSMVLTCCRQMLRVSYLVARSSLLSSPHLRCLYTRWCLSRSLPSLSLTMSSFSFSSEWDGGKLFLSRRPPESA